MPKLEHIFQINGSNRPGVSTFLVHSFQTMIFKKRNDLKKIFKISLVRQNIRNLSLVKYALLQIKERYKIRVQRCTFLQVYIILQPTLDY